MNSQNTPVHIHLWHHDFWRMAVANLLLTMSVYMLIPTLPLWLADSQGMTLEQVGLVMGGFGAGLFLLGAFTSFLVQHYRRNWVCITSVLIMIGMTALLYYLDGKAVTGDRFGLLLWQRVLFGAAFGLAQMVLASTLIIDTSESFQRTEANHSASWFARFSLSLGPVAGLVLYPLFGFRTVLLVAAGCDLLAVILILLIHFPFRAPDDHVPVISFDRFFLPQGILLFINLLLITRRGVPSVCRLHDTALPRGRRAGAGLGRDRALALERGRSRACGARRLRRGGDGPGRSGLHSARGARGGVRP